MDEKYKETCQELNEYTKQIDEIVEKITFEYTNDLDTFIESFDVIVNVEKKKLSADILEEYILGIPPLLYFINSGSEYVGIREDVAKVLRQEAYANAFYIAQGSVASKTKEAEAKVQKEDITKIIYQRAYKNIKYKIEASIDILNSCKKVYQSRLLEQEIGRVTPNRDRG